MTSGQETLLAFAVIATCAGAAHGWFSDKSNKFKENKLNRDLRQKLEADRHTIEQQGLYASSNSASALAMSPFSSAAPRLASQPLTDWVCGLVSSVMN